ncbi:hypothetical protein JT131_00500 [Helicobacter pylori]|nr:hypothetical protein [Helicobacter pylori]
MRSQNTQDIELACTLKTHKTSSLHALSKHTRHRACMHSQNTQDIL